MATTRSPQKQPTTRATSEAIPEPASPTAALQALLAPVIACAPQALRPALIGPSGVGKTAIVHAVAHDLGLPVVVLHARHLWPEDLAMPRLRPRQRGVTLEPLPQLQAAMDAPRLVFLDELDKAAPDTLAALLPLLWERSWQGLTLHPETRLVVALQPPAWTDGGYEELYEALVRRLIFLPVGADWGYVARAAGVPAELLRPLSELGQAVAPPVGDPAPRTVVEVCRIARLVEPPVCEAVIRGVVSERWWPTLRAIAAAAVPTVALDLGAAIAATPDRGLTLAGEMRLGDLIAGGPMPWLLHGCSAAFLRVQERILIEAPDDLAYTFFAAGLEGEPGEWDAFVGEDPQRVHEAFAASARRIVAARRAQGRDAQGDV